MITDIRNSGFPAQKLGFKAKDEEWRIKCVNGAESLSLWRNETLRKSYQNKRINYNLYSDILDQEDVERTCNPYNILGFQSPAKMQNYPIANPKIDLLYGEAIKRRFNWTVRVANEDAISKKEEDLKQLYMELFTRHIQETSKSEEEIKKELMNFEKFKTYEYQDIRERRATHILKYLYQHLNLDMEFAKGFKDALICSEEVYMVDIIAGEPILKKLNPLNVHIIRNGESPYFEDADIITIVNYLSPGQIIDKYHEYLKEDQIDFIERGMQSRGTANNAMPFIDIGRTFDSTPIGFTEGIEIDLLANAGALNNTDYRFDGTIKVTTVYWKSFRKVQKLTYYDEFGDEQMRLVDEYYKPNKLLGEQTETLWINEWWEGHKIGGLVNIEKDNQAIYVRMQPKEIQFRSMENPSKCNPGIIGTIYNTNDNRGVSLMDRMKPYQYLYNILAYNTELMVSKNLGKIMRLDLAYIPEEWETDKWLSFAIGMNMAVQDSFNEGHKGIAQGKLAGTMQQNNPVIDMQMGDSIQLYMNMMAFIKQEMGEISGVSEARQGQISTREAVGNVEREVTQSSHITEYWFMEHDFVKLRALSALLETAKYAWRNKQNKKVQFVLDDQSTTMFDIDGEQFNECEYGIQITDGRSSTELLQVMKQLAHAGIQTGSMKFSQLLDIYGTDSIASIRNKFTNAEIEQQKREDEQFKAEQQAQQKALEMNAQMQDKQMDFEREKWDREDARIQLQEENKLRMKLIDKHSDGEEEPKEDNTIDLEKLKQQADKIKKDHEAKMRAQKETERHNKVTEEQKDKEISIKRSKPTASK